MKRNKLFIIGFICFCLNVHFLDASQKNKNAKKPRSIIIKLEDLHKQPIAIQRRFGFEAKQLDYANRINNDASSELSNNQQLYDEDCLAQQRCDDFYICCKISCVGMVLCCAALDNDWVQESFAQALQSQIMKRD